MSGKPFRGWLFTVYGERESEGVQFLESDGIKAKKIRYATWQREKCPRTHRLHLQGYVEFSTPFRLRACQSALGIRDSHVEPRKGSREQAKEYCQKQDTRVDGPWEVGTWISGQGSRQDLNEVKEALDADKSSREVSDQFFSAFVKFHRGISAYRLLHAVRRRWPMEVTVYWGPTGTGKSQAAWARYPEAFLLPPQQSSSGCGWWDGYDGHEDIIVDEFYGWLRYSFMLQLLDRYPLRVETKGGSVEFVGRRICFTSNKAPTEWYDENKFDYAPLRHRITKIYKYQANMFNIQG